VRALPGVEAAAVTNSVPLSGSHRSTDFGIEGRPSPTQETFNAGIRIISPDFFKTFRIPLVEGRLLAESDGAEAPPVVVVNESLARIYFANEDPLGKRIGYRGVYRLIVGVVGDVKHSALDEEAKPEFYLTIAQLPTTSMSMVARTSGDPMQTLASVREQVWAVDKDQPITNIETMERVMDKSAAPRRFNLLLLGVFALVGLALACVGLYGVMSYTVTQRTREIGIRMALGAGKSEVLKLVINQGIKLVLIGVAIGLAGALGLTRFLSGMLYGVKPGDPLTLVAVSALLMAVALLASYIPARQAAKVDPMAALKQD
jgi:predicted permease